MVPYKYFNFAQLKITKDWGSSCITTNRPFSPSYVIRNYAQALPATCALPTHPLRILPPMTPSSCILSMSTQTCSPHTPMHDPVPTRPLALSTLALAALKYSAYAYLTLSSLPHQRIPTSDGHPSYTQLISTSRLHTSCKSQLRPVHLSCNACGYIINIHSSLTICPLP